MRIAKKLSTPIQQTFAKIEAKLHPINAKIEQVAVKIFKKIAIPAQKTFAKIEAKLQPINAKIKQVADKTFKKIAISPQQTFAKIEAKLQPINAKIKQVADKTFKKIASILLFPTRYLGSKTWSILGLIAQLPVVLLKGMNKHQAKDYLFGSGYHFFKRERLSKEETKHFFRFAGTAASVHGNDMSWVEPFGLRRIDPATQKFDLSQVPGEVEIRDGVFFDKKSGLKMMISEDRKGHLIIAFGAKQSGSHLLPTREAQRKLADHQVAATVGNLFGGKAKFYKQADALFRAVQSHPDYKGRKITLTGQCLGGSLATYVALQNEIPAVALNSCSLGAGLQQKIGDRKLRQADRLITQLSVDGDWATNMRVLSPIDRIANFLGLRTPGNFGRKFSIPSDYKKMGATHNYILGSMMAYTGYNNRTRPEELSAEDLRIANQMLPSSASAA